MEKKKLTQPEIIAWIYEHYDDEKFVNDVNNMTFFRKAELKKLRLEKNKK